jgi:hypothetical protein
MMNIQIREEAGTKVNPECRMQSAELDGTGVNEEGRRQNAEVERLPAVAVVPEWWAALPEGEKALLHAIARMLRSAKRSELQEVARAASKWERGIGCFVKVRLIGEHRKAENRKRKWQLLDSGWVRIEGRKSLESCALSPESLPSPRATVHRPGTGHFIPIKRA